MCIRDSHQPAGLADDFFVVAIDPLGLGVPVRDDAVVCGADDGFPAELDHGLLVREASDASFCSVMSRPIMDAPMIAKSASRIAEMVSETGNVVPFFRARMVSRRSTVLPAMTLARMAFISFIRSSGTRTSKDSPMISWPG